MRLKTIFATILAIISLSSSLTVCASDGYFDDPQWNAYGEEYIRNDELLSKIAPIYVEDSSDPFSMVAFDKLQKLVSVTYDMCQHATWNETSVWDDAGCGNDRHVIEYCQNLGVFDWKTKDGLTPDHNARTYAMIKYVDSRVNDGAVDYSVKDWVAQFNNQNELLNGWNGNYPEQGLNTDTPYGYGLLVYGLDFKQADMVVVGKGQPANVQFGNYVSCYMVPIYYTEYDNEFKFNMYFDANNRLLNIVYVGEYSNGNQIIDPIDPGYYSGYPLNGVFVRLSYQAKKMPQFPACSVSYYIQ